MENICGPGVDPAFDQLLWTLGNIARQKPKPLIDTIMYWRKTKGEQAQEAKSELNKVNSEHGEKHNYSYLLVPRSGLSYHLVLV